VIPRVNALLVMHPQKSTTRTTFQKVNLITSLFLLCCMMKICCLRGASILFIIVHHCRGRTLQTPYTNAASHVLYFFAPIIFTREHRRQSKHISKVTKYQLVYSSFFWGLECSKDCKCGMTNGLEEEGDRVKHDTIIRKRFAILVAAKANNFNITLTW